MIKKQHAEACRWFLETPQYADWADDNKLGNHCGVLWIKGKPGSGKSTLIKFILSHARRSMKGTTIVSFFFNFAGNELQKSTIGLYRSLLLQLLQERPDLQSILDTANIELPWSLATLQYIFTIAITKFGRGSLICFIDALDECEESQIEGILRFFGGICQGAVSSHIALRVCLASRHTTELKIPGLEFVLQAYGHSIVNYLKHSLKIGHSDVAESIHSEVRKKASGSFKWAELAVSWLNGEYAKDHDLNRLLSALHEFPTDHASLPDAISAYSEHGPTSPAADQTPSMKKYSEILRKELDVENPKRVRSRRPKVKTGCNNCKQRRIKCDEKRPECTQCVRSRKHCAGYPPLPRPSPRTVESHPSPSEKRTVESHLTTLSTSGSFLTPSHATLVASSQNSFQNSSSTTMPPPDQQQRAFDWPKSAPHDPYIPFQESNEFLGVGREEKERRLREVILSERESGTRFATNWDDMLLSQQLIQNERQPSWMAAVYPANTQPRQSESRQTNASTVPWHSTEAFAIDDSVSNPATDKYLQPDKPLMSKEKSQKNIEKCHRQTDYDPSPSDSGYATLSHDSRTQVNKLDHDNRSDDDVQTVYTEVSGHFDVRTESYVETFADELFTKIGGMQLSADMVQKISDSLPTLLKALALTIGSQNKTKAQRDLMVFIHKQREAITRSFESYYNHVNDLDCEATTSREPKPTEIMDRWLASRDESNFEKFNTEPPEDTFERFPQEEFPERAQMPGPEEYRKILVENPIYMWMLARLRRDLILSAREYTIPNYIMGVIQSRFPRTKTVSRSKCPEEVQVTFDVKWDIMGFLCQQDYGIPHSEAIANSVTLTGSGTYAQALTCRQYMAQMWPLTGSQTLKLIQETLKSTEHKKTLFFSTPCRLSLEASIYGASNACGSAVSVTATGLPYFIAEIGEQLSWMGSALRPSLSHAVTICKPYLAVSDINTQYFMECPLTLNLEYDVETLDSSAHKPNGQCWSYLFSTPVIAGGFPILHRQEPDTGLEMPLELMIALTGTKYLNSFNSHIFIKGFNTMLVPAKQSEELIIWHLLCSQDPSERISYLLSDFEPADISKTGLEKCRHVLGWCADVTSIVGTTLASYDIGRSRLPKAHSHHMLEKVQISAGQFVTGTAAFTLGNREKPVHISRFGYLTKLQWISAKHMVLWDEGDKRGWLVNGASALLHVLRASLEHSKRRFQSAWLLDPNALKDPLDLSRPDASLQVLIDEDNRNLTLYMDKTEVYEENVRESNTTNNISRRQTRHYRLEDRIEHIYNILEKLIDHQTDVERRGGMQINIRPRQYLEGWDFKDLVKDGDPIFPRVTTLPTIGKGWVDFTRAIHAVTLFGSGFGELIRPRQTSASICSRWSLLPKESYYLAACVSNLLEIMEEDGDAASNPRRLCDNIIWHMKRATFDPCPCIKDAKHSHHDPVQALFPLKFTRSLKKKAQVDLRASGAVIFGHNMSLHWHWKDTGDPVKGDPPIETSWVLTDPFGDSGIGSSLSSSCVLSASDPSSAGSTGDKSPIQSQLTLPPSPPQMPARGSKRALRGIVESVSKKMRR
ncbi:hypothetical protein F5Y01DRAFT_229273 [Xylaria sp. FL0043]|nr:hypothetical protein F5Y01DRAFT_229273 [Xylaria sp. FL0043]